MKPFSWAIQAASSHAVFSANLSFSSLSSGPHMPVGGVDPLYSGWTTAESSASCRGPSSGNWEWPGSNSQLGRGKICSQGSVMPSRHRDPLFIHVLMEGIMPLLRGKLEAL